MLAQDALDAAIIEALWLKEQMRIQNMKIDWLEGLVKKDKAENTWPEHKGVNK